MKTYNWGEKNLPIHHTSSRNQQDKCGHTSLCKFLYIKKQQKQNQQRNNKRGKSVTENTRNKPQN